MTLLIYPLLNYDYGDVELNGGAGDDVFGQIVEMTH